MIFPFLLGFVAGQFIRVWNGPGVATPGSTQVGNASISPQIPQTSPQQTTTPKGNT